MPLQLRRGNAADLSAITPAEGEVIYVRPPISSGESPKLYVGDGTTQGGWLVTGFNEADAKDAFAESLADGMHTGIRFSYDTVSRALSASVDFDIEDINFGNINASIIGTDSSTIVDADTGIINSSSLFIGGANITVNGDNASVNLPVDSTLAGNPFGIRIGTDDSTVTSVLNNDLLDILGGDGIGTSIDGDGILRISNLGNVLRGTTTSFADAGDFYIPFIQNEITLSTVLTNGGLKFKPATQELESQRIFGTISVGAPLVNATDMTTGTITANNVLEIVSLLNTGTNRHIIQLGSNTVDGRLRVMSNSFKNLSQVVIDQYHSSADSDGFRFLRGRGTSVSPSIVQVGDEIADINFAAWDGGTNRFAANFIVTVADTPSSGVMPSEINFRTTNSTGTTASAIKLTKDQETDFGGPAVLKSYTNTASRDAAITSPREGMIIFITDIKKYQGYVLDTGLAGGGAPNFNPGWVNLN
jgi:hypothetical protein